MPNGTSSLEIHQEIQDTIELIDFILFSKGTDSFSMGSFIYNELCNIKNTLIEQETTLDPSIDMGSCRDQAWGRLKKYLELRTADGRTLLHVAAEGLNGVANESGVQSQWISKRARRLCTVLVKAGADFSGTFSVKEKQKKSSSQTLLVQAETYNAISLVDALIDKNADVNVTTYADDKYKVDSEWGQHHIIHHALTYKRYEIALMLLNHADKAKCSSHSLASIIHYVMSETSPFGALLLETLIIKGWLDPDQPVEAQRQSDGKKFNHHRLQTAYQNNNPRAALILIKHRKPEHGYHYDEPYETLFVKAAGMEGFASVVKAFIDYGLVDPTKVSLPAGVGALGVARHVKRDALWVLFRARIGDRAIACGATGLTALVLGLAYAFAPISISATLSFMAYVIPVVILLVSFTVGAGVYAKMTPKSLPRSTEKPNKKENGNKEMTAVHVQPAPYFVDYQREQLLFECEQMNDLLYHHMYSYFYERQVVSPMMQSFDESLCVSQTNDQLREKLKAAYQHVADSKWKTRDGQSPLFFAIAQGKIDMAFTLLHAGADYKQAVNSEMPLSLAEKKGLYSIAYEIERRIAMETALKTNKTTAFVSTGGYGTRTSSSSSSNKSTSSNRVKQFLHFYNS